MKFVTFNRPASTRSFGEDDGASEATRRVGVPVAQVAAVLEAEEEGITIIRFADGREGVKVSGSFEEVLAQLQA